MNYRAFIIGGLPVERVIEYITLLTHGSTGRAVRNCYVVEHDPSLDNPETGIGACEFNSLHYHGIVSYSCSRSDNDRQITNFKQSVERHSGAYYKGMEVQHIKGMLTYMKVHPKKQIFLVNTDNELNSVLDEINDDDVETFRLRKQKQREEDKDEKISAKDIYRLSEWVQMFNVQSKQQMFDIITQTSYKREFLSLFCKRSFDQSLEKAMYIVQQECLAKTFAKLSDLVENAEFADCYSPLESAIIVKEWAKIQGIDLDLFVTNLIDIVDRNRPKVNTLMLQGESNAGKTYIVRSVLKLCKYFGEINQGIAGYQFMYADCINKRVISINEPYFDVAMIEQLKIVLEGRGTFVHVKNKKDDWLQPTPVIITCNSHVWRHCRNEEHAIRNRCIVYEGLRAAPFLEKCEKDLHPYVWMYLLLALSVSENVTGNNMWQFGFYHSKFHPITCGCVFCVPYNVNSTLFLSNLL